MNVATGLYVCAGKSSPPTAVFCCSLSSPVGSPFHSPLSHTGGYEQVQGRQTGKQADRQIDRQPTCFVSSSPVIEPPCYFCIRNGHLQCNVFIQSSSNPRWERLPLVGHVDCNTVLWTFGTVFFFSHLGQLTYSRPFLSFPFHGCRNSISEDKPLFFGDSGVLSPSWLPRDPTSSTSWPTR